MSQSLLRTRLFVAVYEERSFTAAAAREFSTQPGVSQHIQKLEDQLGVKLFHREGGSVTATPAADAYYAACQKVLRAEEEAMRVARAFAGSMEGEVSIGVTPTTAAALLAPTLAAFMRKNPNVVVRVVEEFSASIVDQVVAGALDFAVVPGQVESRAVQSSLFTRTPEFLVSAPATTGLPPFAPVRIADLAPLKLIVPGLRETRRHNLDRYLLACEAQVVRKLEINTILGNLHLVEQTDWVTILPGLMMIQQLRGDRLRLNPLTGPQLMLDIFEVHPVRKPLSTAASAFLEELRREANRLDHEIAAKLAVGPNRNPNTTGP